MGRIKVLDQNMINMIAAGEVIERPASVVKELMENCIDAGATRIIIALEDGGRKLISVSDNGVGMDAEDLRLAFEPHATSKIISSSDLHVISTLGFRGEALASIGSVAQVEAVSRIKTSTGGNRIIIDCGDTTSATPCSSDSGTTIQVRNLFYKMPARRKFLKTANTELGHITEVFIRIALGNSNIGMTLIHNNKELYQLSENQNIRQRITELFSSEVSEGLIETECEEKGMHIFALIGTPDISRTSNKLQYIFLNGRFIKDKFISHAIREAYHGLTDVNRFGVVFLFLKMPVEDFDVNVHPTKIEVRFYNANLVHSQILACLREKLLSTDLDTKAKFDVAFSMPKINIAGDRSQKISDAMAEFFKKHRSSASQPQFSFGREGKSGFTAEHPYKQAEPRDSSTIPPLPSFRRTFIQLHDSFIVTQTEDGFVIIDQHALHERILYETLQSKLAAGNLESQRLLIPESFELTESQQDVLVQHKEIFEKMGIEFIPFGPRSIAIQSFPTILAKANPADFIKDILDLLMDKDKSITKEQLLNEIASMAACKAAIKAGQPLNDREIEQLLAEREIIENPSRCPHGRPSTIKFSISDLEKQFKRK